MLAPHVLARPYQVTQAAAPAQPLAPVHATLQRALLDRWATWLSEQQAQAQLAPATLRLYAQGARAWLGFLEGQARTDSPTSSTVGAFLAALVPSRRPGSANALLSAAKSLYRWAASVDAYPDIARPIRPVRVDRDGPLPCLGHQEVARLVSLIDGERLADLRDRALVLTLYSTACRCVSLHRSDVRHLDLVAGALTHRPKGHRGHDTIAYLSPAAASACAAYLAERHRRAGTKPDEPLWIATDHRSFGRRLGTRWMRRIVLDLMLRAGHARRGVDGRLVAPGVYSAHSLRRSAVTTTADAHGIEVAQALAGHATVTTTRRAYARAKHDQHLRSVAMTLNTNAAGTVI